MSRPKKEYNNIFAKMADNHNKIVPLLRSLALSSVKIRNTKIIKLRDTLEYGEKVLMSIDLFTEYLITNSFILDYLEKDGLNTSYELIKTKNKENVLIGISLIYSLIEAKKEEIKTKLNV